MIVDPDFCDHWKTRMLVGLLGGDEAGPVYVLRLWSHCQNRRQSVFANLGPEAIKAICRFPGPATLLESAMETAGFLKRRGEDLEVCNWEVYNAALLAAWQNGRKGGRPKSYSTQPTGDNEVTAAHSVDQKPSGKPRGSRVEKSREEKRRGEFNTACSGAAKLTISMSPPSGDFEKFYAAYGRDLEREDALLAWVDAIGEEEPEKIISMAGLFSKIMRESERATYMPTPANWLRKRKWRDNPKDWEPRKPTKGATSNAGIPSTSTRCKA